MILVGINWVLVCVMKTFLKVGLDCLEDFGLQWWFGEPKRHERVPRFGTILGTLIEDCCCYFLSEFIDCFFFADYESSFVFFRRFVNY